MINSRRGEYGFTIEEVIVTLVVMVIFLTLLFQMFVANVRQQALVERRSVASDLALTNLRKIQNKDALISGTTACVAGNDRTRTPDTTGTLVPASLFTPESTSSTILGNAVQTLSVVYPRGCNTALPVMLISKVCFNIATSSSVTPTCPEPNTNPNTDSVSHETYVNASS